MWRVNLPWRVTSIPNPRLTPRIVFPSWRRPDFLVWFCALSAEFPLASHVKNQRARLVMPSAGTTLNEKWGTFHMGDFWTGGHVDDLLSYYDVANPRWRPSAETFLGGE